METGSIVVSLVSRTEESISVSLKEAELIRLVMDIGDCSAADIYPDNVRAEIDASLAVYTRRAQIDARNAGAVADAANSDHIRYV